MRGIKGFYRAIIREGNRLQGVLLFIMRLFIGFGFMEAGYSKLQNMPSTTQFFSGLGIPFPEYMAYFVGGLELFGGLLLLLGFAARLISIPLAITMIVAYLTAHLDALMRVYDEPSIITEQAPFLYLLTALFVLAFGPGFFSIDGLLKRYVFREYD